MRGVLRDPWSFWMMNFSSSSNSATSIAFPTGERCGHWVGMRDVLHGSASCALLHSRPSSSFCSIYRDHVSSVPRHRCLLKVAESGSKQQKMPFHVLPSLVLNPVVFCAEKCSLRTLLDPTFPQAGQWSSVIAVGMVEFMFPWSVQHSSFTLTLGG